MYSNTFLINLFTFDINYLTTETIIFDYKFVDEFVKRLVKCLCFKTYLETFVKKQAHNIKN